MLTLASAVPVGAQSVLPNGQFEQLYSDYGWPQVPFWDFTTNTASTYWAKVNYSTTYPQDGTHYLLLDHSYANSIQVTHMIFPVEPGASYHVRFYYRVDAGQAPSGLTSVKLRWFNDYARSMATQMGEQTLKSDLGAVTNGWVAADADITVPKEIVAADFLISGSAATGKIAFDNFTVEKTSGPYTATLYMVLEANTFQSASGSVQSTAQPELVGSMAGLLAQVGAGEYIFAHNMAGNDADNIGVTHYRFACLLASLWGVRLDFSYDSKNGCWNLMKKLLPDLPKAKYLRYDYSDNLSCRWVMTLCGLEQCLAVNDSIASLAESKLGITQQESVMKNSGGTDTEAKAWTRFTANAAANRNLVLENTAEAGYLGNHNSNANYKYYLSDMATANRSWLFWDTDRGEPENTYLAWMNTNFRHLGVMPGDEGNRIAEVSVRGGTVVPGDWAWNIATHQRLANIKPRKPVRARPRTMRDLSWENGVSYCTFMMTDGDNLIVTMGTYATDTRWFGSTRRAVTPMGWQLPPSVSRLTPVVNAHFLDPLSVYSLKDDECALTGLSGDGVFYVGAAGDTAHTLGALTPSGRDVVLTQQAVGLNQWMKEIAINSISGFVWNKSTWDNSQSGWDVFGAPLERPLGFLVDTYDKSYTGALGGLKWTQDKNGNLIPVKACDYALWEPAQTSYGHTHTDMATIINNTPHPATPTAASFVHVSAHAWSWQDTTAGQLGIMEEVYLTKQLLASYVRMVRPDEFMMQMRLRLQTSQELNNYAARLQSKLDQLDALTAPSAAAGTAKSAAKTALATAKGQIAATPETAFNGLKEADRLTEVARLSYVTLAASGRELSMGCPMETAPLYHFALSEIDATALPVRQYEVQFSATQNFGSPAADVLVDGATLTHANAGQWARVRAQGDSHGDWGEWSAALQLPEQSASRHWQLWQ
jgi:hypothetical protein